MLWASKSFILNHNSVEKNIDTQQTLFFLKKDQVYKTKKNNYYYLIMIPVKMRLLIFLVLRWYGLACKYRIISQISIFNWMQNCIFRYFWYCIFIFLRSSYNLLRQVRWFVTWWVESTIISSDITKNIIIREKIEAGEKRNGSR